MIFVCIRLLDCRLAGGSFPDSFSGLLLKLLTAFNELLNASGQLAECHFRVDVTETEFLLTAMKPLQIQDALESAELPFE